jgi:hypothetical protein
VGVAKERERQAIRDPMRQIATFGLEPGRLPRTAGIADPCPWDPGAMVAKMLPQFGASPAEASGAQELWEFQRLWLRHAASRLHIGFADMSLRRKPRNLSRHRREALRVF